MSTNEVAQGLVDLCRKGDLKGAVDTYYAPNILSIEPDGGPQSTSVGLEAIYGKMEWFQSTFEVHSAEVKGPFVHLDQFAVEFDFDVTHKETGNRSRMHEIGVYKVVDGKVAEERFFFAVPTP